MNTVTRYALVALALTGTLTTSLAQKPTTKPAARPATAQTKPAAPAKSTTSAAKPALNGNRPQTTVASAAAPKSQTAPAAKPAASAEPATGSKAEPARSTAQKPARSSALSGRNKYLNAGIGVGAYYGGGLPLGASFEVDLKDNISVGGSVDYARYGHNYGGYRWNWNFIYIGARASYHFAEVLNISNPKFDPYAGLSLGFRHASYSDNDGYNNDYYNGYNSGLFFSVHAGSRYMFTEKIGGFAEVGYGVAALRLGVTAKF